MPADRHPDHRPHDGHPVTHHHREHAIAIYDRRNPADHFDDLYEYEPPEPADVTVSDLLDAHYGRTDVAYWNDLYSRAQSHVIHSFDQLREAIKVRDEAYRLRARLSPEERAEFDRRTT